MSNFLNYLCKKSESSGTKLPIKWFVFKIISIAFCFNHELYSQLPTVLPPSPEASALFRMLDVSMNNSRGVPNISIPVYEIKSGGLTVPISISYNAEGRKAFDQTGPIGLAWSLNAGGMISRTIHGKPDDRYHFPYDLKSASELNNKKNYDYLASLYNGYEYDTEYDIFSYYFGSQSGKFVSDPITNEIYLLPGKPLKVESNSFPTEIIDDKGVVYRFQANEYSNESGNPVTSKSLSSITSVDGKTSITFTYSTFSSVDALSTQDYIITDNDSRLTGEGGYRHFSSTLKNNNNYRTYSIQRLKEIVFPEGRLQFVTEGTTDMIKSIQVFNSTGDNIKTIEFKRSMLDAPMFSGLGFTYKLDEIYFKDRYARTIEKYSFEYEPSIANLDTRNRDYWGYLNFASNNIVVPPYSNIEVFEGYNGKDIGTTVNLNGGSRAPDIASKAGVLKKIIYPTGGSTEFSYENNQYWHVGRVLFAGGLRVSQIKSNDNNGSALIKTYKYGANECGYGDINFYNVQQNDMSYEKRTMTGLRSDNGYGYPTESYRTRVYSSELLPEISEVAYDPIFYSQITEYAGTISENSGKSVYTYTDKSHSTLSQFPLPAFPGNTNYGDFSYPVDDRLSRRCVSEYNLWKQSNLEKTDIYKNTGDKANPYQIVRSLTYTYNSTQSKVLKGLHIYKYLDFPEGSDEYKGATEIGLPVFLLADYRITIGKEELASTWETDYTDNGSISTGSTYKYNDQLLVSEVQRSASNGKLLITKFKYPADFKSAPQNNTLFSEMARLNMLNYVIEENQFVDQAFLKGTKTNYTNWSNTSGLAIYPQTVEEKMGEKGYETLSRFYGYSERGNILSVSKENDVKHSYIWGYNNAYPIAHVINAEPKDIFHTSFEEADGNTSIGDSKTGNRSRTGGYIKSISGLTNGNYILSWWEKSGGVWNFQASIVPVTGNAYNINLSGQVDEVRFYPKNAQMATYTYNPLIGMTSECDLNDKITYYEYDDFGRVRLIRDEDRNILKKYDYRYAGQQANYTNTIRSQDFKKSNCSPGYTGSTVTYTVPAGTYSSTQSQQAADSLAQGDIDANGPNYANLQGTCSSVYASLTYEYLFTDLSGTYGEVYIRFYADRDKTQSISPANLTVNYKKTDSDTYPYEWNYSIKCSGDVLLEYTLLQGFVDGIYHRINFGLLNGNYTIIY